VNTIQYKTLGKTGIKIPKLSFGGIPIRDETEKQALEVVNRCLDHGVNFIHTSITYGDSTQKIKKILQERRDECTLAVKIGGGRTRQHAEKVLQDTFEALKVDHIEIAELPINANDFPKAMEPGGAYEAFTEAQEQGLIDHIGITGHDIEFLNEAIKTEKFDNVIAPYNYVANKAEEELFKTARSLDIGIIAMKVLGVGGIPEVEKALRYAWDADIDTALVGMRRVEEVEMNVEVANKGKPLTEDEQKELQEIAERIKQEKRLKFSGKITKSHAEGVTRVILTNTRT
jgi:predicted aldo/keto reductase-like oxidoreductase